MGKTVKYNPRLRGYAKEGAGQSDRHPTRRDALEKERYNIQGRDRFMEIVLDSRLFRAFDKAEEGY